MCVCMCACGVGVHGCQKRVLGSLGAEISGSGEPCDVGAGKPLGTKFRSFTRAVHLYY